MIQFQLKTLNLSKKRELEKELEIIMDEKLGRAFYNYEEWHELLHKIIQLRKKLSKL